MLSSITQSSSITLLLMIVLFWITQWSPTRTPSPITTFGPMVHPAPICADECYVSSHSHVPTSSTFPWKPSPVANLLSFTSSLVWRIKSR